MPPPEVVRRAAGFSPCGRYRYWLTRVWDHRRPAVCWLLLNPSTADATRDDPTIRRCAGFARRWGYGGIVVINLFAWRATDPAELTRVMDPVGPENDSAVRSRAAGQHVIAAWGNHGRLLGRAVAVLRLLEGRRLTCLGVTATGQPRHPLYVAGTTTAVPLVQQGRFLNETGRPAPLLPFGGGGLCLHIATPVTIASQPD